MLTRLQIKLVKFLLWLLDGNHRSKHTITGDVKRFTHNEPHYFGSDFGIATSAVRTVPYAAWELITETKSLVCADRHRVVSWTQKMVYVEDLKPGDYIMTDRGQEKVIVCRPLGVRAHMFCLEIIAAPSAFRHLYLTNGIMSHNTTTASCYLLWRAMFRDDTKILIAANKLKGALEVMTRIKYAYEECPDYIKAGVKKFNEGTIAFDNGSIIEAIATTPDAARGKSLTLLYLDEFAFVQPNMASAFYTAVQPTLSTGGSVIITSTPRTDEDQFAQIWKGAQVAVDEFGNETGSEVGENGFYPIQVPWWEHPERDEAWAAPYKADLGPARFAQEFECITGDVDVELDVGKMSTANLFNTLKMSASPSQIDKF
jgi:hypothetical protein